MMTPFETTAPVKNAHSSIYIITLTVILFIILVLPLVLFINLGWFLPEPKYTVSSMNQVLISEIKLSLTNLFINMIVFTIAFFITFVLFFSEIFHFTKLKIISLCLIFAFITGIITISLDIYKSMNYWNILDKSLTSYQNKAYHRGRGGGLGLQKEYYIHFTIPSDNVQSERDVLIPSLKKSGFTIDVKSTGEEALTNLNLGSKFSITPQNKNYLNLNLSKETNELVPPHMNLFIGYNHLFGSRTDELVKPGTTEGLLRFYPND
jgi:hypothetical protein